MNAAVATKAKVAVGTLPISVRQLRALVDPVLPAAGTDDMLPILKAVRVEAQGKWLVAVATDRFTIAVQRIARSEGEWPAWSATIPTQTLRSLFATFKPSRRDTDPEIELTLAGDSLHVTGCSQLLDVQEASIVYPLESGEFPKVGAMLSKAVEAEPGDPSFAFDPAKMARLLSKARGSVTLKAGPTGKAMVLHDGDDWLGLLMPRKLVYSSGESADWSSIFDALGGAK